MPQFASCCQRLLACGTSIVSADLDRPIPEIFFWLSTQRMFAPDSGTHMCPDIRDTFLDKGMT